MNLEDYNSFYHVDISTQIENKWKNDTILGIVKDSKKYSIKIRGWDKEKIKRRFINKNESDSDKKHNKRLVAITYCYLLLHAKNSLLFQ